MKYPENERILIVRPCLKYICLGNKPASKLLSLLLYYARNCDEKEAEYSFMTTQEELIEDLIDEMDVKTLHRTAIPMLRLLGFLDVDGSSYRYKYTVHLNLISYLLANYKDNKREIASALLSEMKEQLDNLPIEQKDTFPIVHVRRQLDNCLIQIDNLPIQLEKCPIQIDICLIPFRQMSNSKRGRKPSPEGHLEGISEDRRLDRDITDNKEKKREREVAHATARSQTSSQDNLSQDNLSEDTVKREAVKASPKEVAHVQNQTHSGNPGNGSQPHLDTNQNSIPLDASLTSQTEHRKDTNKVTEPPAPRKPPTNPVPRRPKQQGLMDELPSPPASKPVEPLAEMTWGTRKCLQWFDYWRGGVLIAKYKLQQAAGCAKGLAEQFDEATVIRIRGDMADDPYYIERGGPDICDVANNIYKYLNKKKPKKEPSNEHKATHQPANAFIERCLDKDYNKKKLEWMREENARRRQAQAEGVQ